MIEQMKAFWLKVKDFLVYILTPIAFIAGYIYYLLKKNKTLEGKVDQAEFKAEDADLKGEQGVIDEKAHTAVDDYNRIRNKYQGGDKTGLH